MVKCNHSYLLQVEKQILTLMNDSKTTKTADKAFLVTLSERKAPLPHLPEHPS